MDYITKVPVVFTLLLLVTACNPVPSSQQYQQLSDHGLYAGVLSGDAGLALLWGGQSGQVLLRLVHGSRETKVALEHEGRYAFTADSRNQARIWRLTDGKLQSRLQLHARQQIFSAVRLIGGGRLLTGSPAPGADME